MRYLRVVRGDFRIVVSRRVLKVDVRGNVVSIRILHDVVPSRAFQRALSCFLV